MFRVHFLGFLCESWCDIFQIFMKFQSNLFVWIVRSWAKSFAMKHFFACFCFSVIFIFFSVRVLEQIQVSSRTPSISSVLLRNRAFCDGFHLINGGINGTQSGVSYSWR